MFLPAVSSLRLLDLLPSWTASPHNRSLTSTWTKLIQIASPHSRLRLTHEQMKCVEGTALAIPVFLLHLHLLIKAMHHIPDGEYFC